MTKKYGVEARFFCEFVREEDCDKVVALYREYCGSYKTLEEAGEAAERLFDKLLGFIDTSKYNFRSSGEGMLDPEYYPYVHGFIYSASWTDEWNRVCTHTAYVEYGPLRS